MIIESKYLKAEFSTKGGELISLQDQKGAQYIWQGAEGLWPGKAPILFPICGFLKENFYYYKNDQYFMQVHGFAANSQFEVTEKSLQSITFTLKSSPRTKMHYPFDFNLQLQYSLNESTLEAKISVHNESDNRILFSYGWHPGFALNWQKNDSIDNYYIALPDNQDLMRRPVNEDGLLQNELEVMKINPNNTFSLSQNSFDQRAIVLENYPYTEVSLRHIHSAKSIDLYFENFKNLALWAQKSANFVCLEPWNGLGDLEGHNNQFIDKKGLIKLPSKKSHEAKVRLTINSD